jgi:hypothetical protein
MPSDRKRGQTPFFLALIGAILGTNLLVMLGFWFGYAAKATGTPAETPPSWISTCAHPLDGLLPGGYSWGLFV